MNCFLKLVEVVYSEAIMSRMIWRRWGTLAFVDELFRFNKIQGSNTGDSQAPPDSMKECGAEQIYDEAST